MLHLILKVKSHSSSYSPTGLTHRSEIPAGTQTHIYVQLDCINLDFLRFRCPKYWKLPSTTSWAGLGLLFIFFLIAALY